MRSLANSERQAALAAVRAQARESGEWRRARHVASTLCLVTGHLRPAAREADRIGRGYACGKMY